MKIRDICAGIADGSHNPPQGIEISDYLMLSSKNVFDDEITFDDPRYLTRADFEQEDRRTKVKEGDVLLTIVGTVGRTAVVGKKMPRFTLQRSVAVLKPKADICSSRYLMYALQGERTHIENSAKGVAQKGIYLNEVSNIDLKIPALSEQESIVIRLDKIVSIIHFYQQQLQKLDELIKSRFIELFVGKGYEEKSVRDVLDTAFWLMPATPKFVENGSVPYITSKNIKNRSIDFDNVKYITTEAYESISSNRPTQIGDILISMIGTLGQTAVIKDARRFYGQNLYLLRLNASVVNTVFFCEFFNSDRAQHKLQAKRNQSTQAYLKANHVEDLLLPLPPMEIQEQFAAFVAEVDKSKLAVTQSLEKLETLKKSLMQQYFG